MIDRSLTILGVKRLLTRAGIDYSQLTITQSRVTASYLGDGLRFGPWETYTEVRLDGPRELRREAENALFYAGYSSAPFPDYSLWSKPPGWDRKKWRCAR
jgi:hypothetical protein